MNEWNSSSSDTSSEVAETSSFTRAAERCFVTQSALSHQIAALERELGQRLFVRSSRSVRLSEAGGGVSWSTRGRRSGRRSRRGRAQPQRRGCVVTGTLRIGVIPTVTAVDIPEVLVAYRAAHPFARVELQGVGNSDVLMARLRHGELDVALLGRARRSGTTRGGFACTLS